MSGAVTTFVHISDTHINPDPEYGAQNGRHATLAGAEALVQQVNALPFRIDFVLHTGDVIYDPDPDAYDAARRVLSQIRYPVYYVAGNHDDANSLQTRLLERPRGQSPFYYAFEVNGVQMLCLDSNGPATPPAGFVHREQLDWLETACAARDDRPLVVAVHHHPLPVGVPWLDGEMRMTNGEDFHRALLPGRNRLRGVFFGHVHQNLDMYRDGILYTSTLSSWYQLHAWPGMTDTVADVRAEPGFSVVSITPEQTYIRRWRFRVQRPESQLK